MFPRRLDEIDMKGEVGEKPRLWDYPRDSLRLLMTCPCVSYADNNDISQGVSS